MARNIYITEQSNLLKERLKLFLDSGKSKSELAKKVGVVNIYHFFARIGTNNNFDTGVLYKFNKALDELGIPKVNEVFEGIMQGLKETKEFMQGKDNGCTIYNREGRELKGQEAVDYYQSLKKAKDK